MTLKRIIENQQDAIHELDYIRNYLRKLNKETRTLSAYNKWLKKANLTWDTIKQNHETIKTKGDPEAYKEKFDLAVII